MTVLVAAVYVVVVYLILLCILHAGEDSRHAREQSSWLVQHQNDRRQRQLAQLPTISITEAERSLQ